MSFSFKYKSVRLPSGTIYRPLIPLTFNGDVNLNVFALLDSGSDMTLINREMAELLGIDSRKDNLIFGVSKIPVNVNESELTISFGKGHEHYTFKIPVMIISEHINIPIIIGRTGFFDEFKITFIQSEKRVEFKKAGGLLYLKNAKQRTS